jgi:hypothetical protein
VNNATNSTRVTSNDTEKTVRNFGVQEIQAGKHGFHPLRADYYDLPRTLKTDLVDAFKAKFKSSETTFYNYLRGFSNGGAAFNEFLTAQLQKHISQATPNE